jgi:hypothetical protein
LLVIDAVPFSNHAVPRRVIVPTTTVMLHVCPAERDSNSHTRVPASLEEGETDVEIRTTHAGNTSVITTP